MNRYCQACGSPIYAAEPRGTEADGQYGRDICPDCYRGGQFGGDFRRDAQSLGGYHYGNQSLGDYHYGRNPGGDYHYIENPMALAAPYYPGMYGFVGYNLF